MRIFKIANRTCLYLKDLEHWDNLIKAPARLRKRRLAKRRFKSKRNQYPPEWTEFLREMIRKRDKWTCQLCGLTWEENGRALSVHHIDEDKTNCASDNLVSLYNDCHDEIHGRFR